MATRTTYTIDDDVLGLLERVGNKSSYLSTVVRERWQAWQEAYALLVTSGQWTGRELLAACDCLNGYWHVRSAPAGPAIALNLSDSEALSGICSKWGIDPTCWALHVKDVREVEEEANAVLAIAREFWAGNEALDGMLRRDETTED